MSHPWRRIGILAVAVLIMAPTVWASKSEGMLSAAGDPAGVSLARGPSNSVWRAFLAYWIPLDRLAGSARHGSRGRTGFGRTPACENGGSLDPNGHCIKSGLACDAGGSLDPNGRCRKSAPACDEGGSLDPDGRCTSH